MWGHAQREYYYISEIMEGCGISRGGLDNCISSGALPVCVWLPALVVNKMAESIVENKILLTKTETVWEGYTQIFPADYRKILQQGRAYLREFRGKESNEIISLKHGAMDIPVRLEDLVVLASAKRQFENDFCACDAKDDCKVDAIWKLGQTKTKKQSAFDSSFKHIEYNGREFNLGTIQASIVKQLYDAFLSGEAWVNGKQLLQKAGSESFAIRNVFGTQPFWRELVDSDKKGMYRLTENFSVSLPELANA